MNKKFHIYLIILILGLQLLPASIYACETKLEKKCCEKEMTTKSDHHECLNESKATDKDNGCNGKCGHSHCTTTSVNITFALFNENIFTDNFFSFLSEKQKFFTTDTFILSGYSSLWLIPKIS